MANDSSLEKKQPRGRRVAASIDQICICLIFQWEQTQAQNSIFTVKVNGYIGADVAGGQERDSYAQIGIHAILKFKSCPLVDCVLVLSEDWHILSSSFQIVKCSILFLYFSPVLLDLHKC